MGFFNKYPYTDEHELNIDWIIAKINALKDRVKAVEDVIKDIVVVTPNDGKLTIKRNNTIVGDFTANQATDENINIVVPENTSDLNNDSDFITSSDLPDMSDYYDKDETDALLSDKADISSLAAVATTGDYDDLINTPNIPAAQVNSDWNANSGVAEILNKPAIPDAYSKTESDTRYLSAPTELLYIRNMYTTAYDYTLSDTVQNYRFLIFSGAWVGGNNSNWIIVPTNLPTSYFSLFLNNLDNNSYYTINSFNNTTVNAIASSTNVTIRVYGIK